MLRWFRNTSVLFIVVIILSFTVWGQEPTADPSAQTSAPSQNAAPPQNAPVPNETPEQLPSNVRIIPDSKDGNISSESLKPKVIESWITPALEGSQFRPADPVELGESGIVENVYKHEVQRVGWRAGDPIDLYIAKPVGVKKPPVILYLYSYPFETDRFVNPEFCKFLVRNGVAAVGFPSALTAARYHDRPMKEWFVSEMKESLATTAHDVQLILNYLSDRGDFDMSRVGIFGDGSGASIAILAAAVDPRIKSLDLINPWGDWPDWVQTSTRIPDNERSNFLKQEWLDANAPMDPLKWLPLLKTPNVRLQFVKTVGITPPEAQAKMEAAAPRQAKIVRYDDTAAFKALIADGSGLDWLKSHVVGEAAQQYGAARQPRSDDSSHSKNSR